MLQARTCPVLQLSDQFPSVTFHSPMPDTIRREDAIAVIFLHQAMPMPMPMLLMLQLLCLAELSVRAPFLLQVAWRSHSETDQAREIAVTYLTLGL